ncbi:GLPGLI family protein [Chitinophaga rhizophila]|uniref:GLPGLI family protein n=1 Tax=Chitinophaga rhizophila TaxID=2866212 RepID=A0ABS7G886_9BACT|nr:GLPGLI family protein [Chitinophaga rhizophila]MBW8683883.1 GLPGLI family protein [Chitinophaga rhizophila]
MMRFYFIILLMVFSCAVYAQQDVFVNSGKIVFERRVNTFAVMDMFIRDSKIVPLDQRHSYLQQYKSNNRQFWTDDFELYFDSVTTVYRPQGLNNMSKVSYIGAVAYNNKVISSLDSGRVMALKQAFDHSFLIKDTIRKMRWKLTEETREIAGFQCRRANALMSDSIYIVAYYAETIPARGGPESFNGLPGMILGVALPHQHITIFAKSVNRQDVTADISRLRKQLPGEVINRQQFKESMKKILYQFSLNVPWVQVFMDI